VIDSLSSKQNKLKQKHHNKMIIYKNKFALGKFLIAIMLFTQVQNPQAQLEPQFTQYMFNEMFINPAYAGTREAISLTAAYRNQWVGMDGAPVTQTFSAHAPLGGKKLGIGLAILNESIGVTHDLGAYASYAYHIQVKKETSFSLGLQAGVMNHQEQLLDVKIQDYGDNSFIANTPQLTLPNAGFGMYYHTKKFYLGLSIPRLLQNKIDITRSKMVSNKVNIPYWHYYFMGGYVYQLTDGIKLKPTFMVKAVSGAPLEADIGFHTLLNEVFWIGASYRTKDSWAAITSFQATKQLRVGYSFDYSTQGLQKYNSGTHEITLGFDFSFNKNKIITPRYF
jgi:type IX secretion system PorP/SprF family membrane protein